MERFIDFIYLLYFGSHIPIAMFIDSQAVLPRWIYPKPAVELVDWYIDAFGDSMMKGRDAWFQSFIVCEILFQFPFFFVALYAYWKGVSKNRWIRIPVIVYSSHVTTVLTCIYHHLFLHDFSKDELRDVMDWYTSEYGDSMMKGTPAWYQSFIVCEIFLLFPFSFAAIYAYCKGVSKCRWIRVPMIVYSTHVVTALLCIYHHIFLHDFSKDEIPGPKTLKDRLVLGLFYLPYFVVPIILLIDSLFHPIYRESVTVRKRNDKKYR